MLVGGLCVRASSRDIKSSHPLLTDQVGERAIRFARGGRTSRDTQPLIMRKPVDDAFQPGAQIKLAHASTLRVHSSEVK